MDLVPESPQDVAVGRVIPSLPGLRAARNSADSRSADALFDVLPLDEIKKRSKLVKNQLEDFYDVVLFPPPESFRFRAARAGFASSSTTALAFSASCGARPKPAGATNTNPILRSALCAQFRI